MSTQDDDLVLEIGEWVETLSKIAKQSSEEARANLGLSGPVRGRLCWADFKCDATTR
jgi:hypothetical protein